jgi:biotin operon repressor
MSGILGDVNRTERLYAIAEELRSAGTSGRTSTWLARRLEVSVRTVKRDVDALLQAGVPIWAQAGRGGGYVLDAEATLPPLNVTAAEAAAIAVALAALPALPFAADARSALSKVLAAMPDAERDRAEDIAARLWLRTPERPPRPAVAGCWTRPSGSCGSWCCTTPRPTAPTPNGPSNPWPWRRPAATGTCWPGAASGAGRAGSGRTGSPPHT